MATWVILRHLGRSTWPGVRRYRNCFDTLGPYWTRSGRRYTGLTKEDADRLGGILGLDLSPSSEFWVEWSGIRVASKDIYFDIEDPMDELRVLFLKNHKRVAGSVFERKATADYVLVDQDEEAKKANIIDRVKRRASKEFDKLSAEDVRRCLRLFGHNASTMGNEQAEHKLFEIVEGNPQKFIDLWVDNKEREIMFLIEEAVAKNVIRKTKNVYRYGSDIIGHGLDDVVAYLSNPANQDLKLAIMSGVNLKEQFLGPEEAAKSKEKVEDKEEQKEVLKEKKKK